MSGPDQSCEGPGMKLGGGGVAGLGTTPTTKHTVCANNDITVLPPANHCTCA